MVFLIHFIGEIRLSSGGKLLTSIADAISYNMGGSSGAVLEIFFRSAGSLSLFLKPAHPLHPLRIVDSFLLPFFFFFFLSRDLPH